MVGLALVVPLACCVVLMIGSIADGKNHGSTADWVVASATVGALGAAVFAAVFAFDALRREAARDQWRDQRERESQASLVAAWAEAMADDPEGPAGPPKMRITISIRNGSNLPVYRAEIEANSSSFISDTPRAPLAILPPGAIHYYVLVLSSGHTDVRTVIDDIAINLVFRDAAGQLWLRDHEGRLTLREN